MLLADVCGGTLPQAVLFDLDGTLIDSAPDLAAAVDATLLQLELPPAGETNVRQWIGNGAAMLVRRALAHAQACVVESLPDADVQAALELFFQHYARLCVHSTTVYAGTETALCALQEQGVAMACVTNKPAQFTAQLLQHLGLARYFPVAVSGDTLAVKKPDPAPLLAAANGLGVNLARCVMVGDSATDVQAARNAGIPVVAVSYGYTRGLGAAALGANAVVDNLVQLLKEPA
jgi:phosphoglycolate phosphatase